MDYREYEFCEFGWPDKPVAVVLIAEHEGRQFYVRVSPSATEEERQQLLAHALVELHTEITGSADQAREAWQ